MSGRRPSANFFKRAFEALMWLGGGSGYLAASGGTPRAGVFGNMVSQASAALAARPIIARRAAWAVASSCVGQSIANTWATHLIGDGPSVRSGHPNRAMRRAIEAAWKRFYARADVEGFDLCSVLIRVVLALVSDGEAILRLVVTPRGELQVQIMPASQLDSSVNTELPDGGSIISGIEYNAPGTPRAYYLFQRNPELPFMSSRASQRIPASDILHIYEPRFPGQKRGVSWLHAVLAQIAELDATLDAGVVKARVSAALCGFVPTDDIEYIPGLQPDPGTGVRSLSMQPGTIMPLLPGQKAPTFTPPSDFDGLNEFLRQQLRLICAGAHVPYELVAADLTQVNFSSSRVGQHAFQRRCAAIRASLLTSRLLEPLFQRVVTLEILSGRLNADLARDAEALFSMTPMFPQWPSVSPFDDTRADALAVANGFASRQQIVSARGRDIEDVDSEIAADSFTPRQVPVGDTNVASAAA